jgi:hypothetical protein
MRAFILLLLLCVPALAQRSPRVVDSVAALLSLPSSTLAPDAIVQGVGGGQFKWDSASTTATNSADVFAKAYGDAAGRWIRQPGIAGRIDLGTTGIVLIGPVAATNSPRVRLTGTNVWIEARQTLKMFSPGLYSGTVSQGAFLQLTDDADGSAEFLKLENYVTGGGSTLYTALVRGWCVASAYTLTSATRDLDGVITVASVSWPDGATGAFTTVTKNATWLTIDAYTVTHSASGKTYTQPAVTRDSNGRITAQPAITVSP